MIRKFRLFLKLACSIATVASFDAVARADEPVRFEPHIRAIFEQRCSSCHSQDGAESDLNLLTHAATLRGGSSGAVVVSGKPSKSRLWRMVSHEESPPMPPQGGKLPAAELDLIRRWIEQGALKDMADETIGPAAGPVETVKSVAVSKVIGLNEAPIQTRSTAVTAVAVHPRHNIVAVAGQNNVILHDAREGRFVAALDFDEGIPYVLRFNARGNLLLAGGGRNGKSGRVAVWSLATGRRLLTVGDELDAVLAADLSPDQSMIALGGPKRKVRIYSTTDGTLLRTIEQHTDWITALAFSPDGVLLATADRTGKLVLWETLTGHEFASPAGHEGAINALSWRADGNALATAGEDGKVRVWDVVGLTETASWTAHAEGVRSVAFTTDGLRVVTSGRDRTCKSWTSAGSEEKTLFTTGDQALFAALVDDERRLIAADAAGDVRLIDVATGTSLARLPTYAPPLIAMAGNPSFVKIPDQNRLIRSAVGAAPWRFDWRGAASSLALWMAGFTAACLTLPWFARRRKQLEKSVGVARAMIPGPHYLRRAVRSKTGQTVAKFGNRVRRALDKRRRD